MTLLEKEVWVGLSGNKVYYENLGYETSHKKKILVKINHVPKGSGVLVKYICDYCNGDNQTNIKDWYKPYYKITDGRRNSDRDCCKKCIGQKSSETRKNNPIPKGRSFGEKYPHLISEWSNKNVKTPFEHSYGSDEKVWWKCKDCKSEYDMPLSVKGKLECKCPFCTGRRVNHTNCLWATHPQSAMLLKFSERGYVVSAGQNIKEDFCCPNCNFSEPKVIQSVVKHGFCCPKCSDGISYSEKFIYNFLSQLKIKVERQKIFTWSKYVQCNNAKYNGLKKYDFYIPSLNCIIEAHGEQHYIVRQRHFRNSVNEIQENDLIKETTAIENGIENYIVINCSYSDKEFIKNNIINSKLKNMVEMDNVDWNQCHSYALSSMVKDVCSLWGGNQPTVKEIANQVDLDVTTVRRYLIQGSKVGLCDYNPQEILSQTIQNNLQKAMENRKVEIIQIERDGNFIKGWNSRTEAEKELNINNISAVLRGKQKTAGGFIWMYKKEYEELEDIEKFQQTLKSNNKKNIIQMSLSGEFIQEWASGTEAAKSLGKSNANIFSVLNKKADSAHGYKWIYKKDYFLVK
jgi:hypothetical protein